jgi:ribose/xylose/arabinose/galactoside ABC-type transport system permease subunit
MSRDKWTRSGQHWLKTHRELVVVYSCLGALLLAGYIVSPKFFSQFNIASITGAALPLAVVAIGQTFVLIAGGIDLSVGSVMSLTAVIGATYMNGDNGRLAVGILLCVGIGAAVGVANSLVVVLFRVQPIIATLGMMAIISGVTLLVTNVPTGSAPLKLQAVIVNSAGAIPYPVLVLLPCFALALLVLRATRFGVHVYALGGDEESTRLSGISPARVRIAAYTICGACAGGAGILLLARLGIGDPVSGQSFMLLSVVAAAIGGTSIFGGRGGVVGTLAGVLIVTCLGNVLSLAGISAYQQQLTYGILIIAVVALYSTSYETRQRLAQLRKAAESRRLREA